MRLATNKITLRNTFSEAPKSAEYSAFFVLPTFQSVTGVIKVFNTDAHRMMNTKLALTWNDMIMNATMNANMNGMSYIFSIFNKHGLITD